MSVRSGQSVTVDFTTRRFDTGNATNADTLPTGTLVVNGVDNGATVTITNITTGVYKASVTLPTLSLNDIVDLRVNATVNSVTDNAVIWNDTKDFFAGSIPDVAAGSANGLFLAGTSGGLNTQAKTDVGISVWDMVTTNHVALGTFGYIYTLATQASLASDVYNTVVGVVAAHIVDTGPSTTVFKTDLTDQTDKWNDSILVITQPGALSQEARPILSYSQTNGTITLSEPLSSVPANGSTFNILVSHVHPVSQIASGVWQDTTASDFTVASSIGKSLFTSGNAPGTASGLSLVGSSMTLTSSGLDSVLIESGIIAGANLTDDAGSQLTAINLRQAMSLCVGGLAGVLTGAATTDVSIKGAGLPTGNTRIDATVDANGNRSALVLKVPT